MKRLSKVSNVSRFYWYRITYCFVRYTEWHVCRTFAASASKTSRPRPEHILHYYLVNVIIFHTILITLERLGHKPISGQQTLVGFLTLPTIFPVKLHMGARQ